jgi:predicted Zn-dependent protease
MDDTQILIKDPPPARDAEERSCSACGQRDGDLAAVETSLFPGVELRRCPRCGARHAASGVEERRVCSCDDCGLPFLTEEVGAQGRRCPDCLSHRIPSGLADSDVAEATEREVRAALEAEWKFVSSPSLSVYLNRLAGQICRCMDAAPKSCRVVLFESPGWWTLALPSGTILLSLGTLVGLEDEAELAFVLAHELAHAASADAAVRLARTGLQVVALEDNGGHARSWSRAAHDLIRLGYGRVREQDADRRAIEAISAMGYDPQSVTRYLERLAALIAQGDSRVGELALAHPIPARRLRSVEEIVAASPQFRMAPRVNREVFRRAAGHNVLATRLERVEGFTDALAENPDERSETEQNHRRFWLAVALILLAAVLGLVAWQFF